MGKPIYIKLHVKFVLALIRHTLDLILNSELRSIFCPPSEAFYHIHTWIQPMCHLTRFYVSYCALEPSVILMAGALFFSFESCASLLKSVPFYMLLFSTNLMSD